MTERRADARVAPGLSTGCDGTQTHDAPAKPPICADVGYSALPSGSAQIATFWTLRCRRELSAMIAWLVINIAVAE
jgi:hypothetical protein